MTPEDVVTFIGVMMWRLTPINTPEKVMMWRMTPINDTRGCGDMYRSDDVEVDTDK